MVNMVQGRERNFPSVSSTMIFRLFLGSCRSCALMYSHIFFTTCAVQVQSGSSCCAEHSTATGQQHDASCHALSSHLKTNVTTCCSIPHHMSQVSRQLHKPKRVARCQMDMRTDVSSYASDHLQQHQKVEGIQV